MDAYEIWARGSGGGTIAVIVVVSTMSFHWNEDSEYYSSSSSSMQGFITSGLYCCCRCSLHCFHLAESPSPPFLVVTIAKGEQGEKISQNARETSLQRRAAAKNGAARAYLGVG